MIYNKLKKGELKDWQPTAFIFGAKAAPGYARAKAIIKYINEVAKLVNNDPDTKDKLKVHFVQFLMQKRLLLLLTSQNRFLQQVQKHQVQVT